MRGDDGVDQAVFFHQAPVMDDDRVAAVEFALGSAGEEVADEIEVARRGARAGGVGAAGSGSGRGLRRHPLA